MEESYASRNWRLFNGRDHCAFIDIGMEFDLNWIELAKRQKIKIITYKKDSHTEILSYNCAPKLINQCFVIFTLI